METGTPIYVDPLTDYGFKLIFGDKELMMSFLNALFEKEGKVITSLTYINKEMTPESREDRTIFYDMRCKVNGEEDIIIEMQHKPQDTFRERALFYMSRSIVAQGANKKNWRYKMHPVYGIFITNFHLKDVQMNGDPISEVVLKNRTTNEIFTDKLRMFFIDLLSFKKSEEELDNDMERWIYNVKNMGTMTKEPKMASRKPFDRLYTMAELAVMPRRERNRYEASLMHYRDMLADKETTRNMLKRGMAESRAEGRAEGRAELKNEIIAAMRQRGMSEAEIADILGM